MADQSASGGSRRLVSLPSGREIILVGTAHVSAKSVDEVREAIHAERPDRVCVEIDAGRYRTLTQRQDWNSLDIVKVVKGGKAFLLLANMVLSSFQRRMGASMGIQPGDEMKAAVEAAQELGIPCHFSDREVQVTLRRAWGRSNFWNRSKLLAALVSSAFSSEKPDAEEIERLKDRSAIDGMMGELADYLPKVKEVLIDERDRYLATRIWECGPGRSLAVLGAGHLPGVEAWLRKLDAGQATADVSDLEELPKPSAAGKIAAWVVPVLLVGLFAAGFFLKDWNFSRDNLLTWLALNCGGAALGAIAALAHPLTVLAALVTAPLGTMTYLSVGVFAGLAEAALRKPRVEDLERLPEDISSLAGFWRNRVTKVLIVFLFSSLGGAIGNFISLGRIFSRFF
jgi:pheromone shutdown-related protein TraB